jgi:hypothetical protein
MSAPAFWLNEDGDYWVAVEEHPEQAEAATFMESFADEPVRFAGRKTESLRDCPIDHLCLGEPNCHCDYHEDEACSPARDVDVWHFISKSIQPDRPASQPQTEAGRELLTTLRARVARTRAEENIVVESLLTIEAQAAEPWQAKVAALRGALTMLRDAVLDYSPRYDHDWRCERRTKESGWDGDPDHPVVVCECGFEELGKATAAANDTLAANSDGWLTTHDAAKDDQIAALVAASRSAEHAFMTDPATWSPEDIRAAQHFGSVLAAVERSEQLCVHGSPQAGPASCPECLASAYVPRLAQS